MRYTAFHFVYCGLGILYLFYLITDYCVSYFSLLSQVYIYHIAHYLELALRQSWRLKGKSTSFLASRMQRSVKHGKEKKKYSIRARIYIHWQNIKDVLNLSKTEIMFESGEERCPKYRKTHAKTLCCNIYYIVALLLFCYL